AAPPDLHSFPTRRSSDLSAPVGGVGRGLYAGLRDDGIDGGDGLRAGVPAPRPHTGDCGSGIDDADGVDETAPWHVRVITSICARSEEHTSELQSRGHLVC